MVHNLLGPVIYEINHLSIFYLFAILQEFFHAFKQNLSQCVLGFAVSHGYYYIPPCVPLQLQALASATRGRYAIETLLFFPPTSSYFTTLHSVAGSPSKAATPSTSASRRRARGARCHCFSRQTAIAKKPGLQIIYLRKDDVASSVLSVKQALINLKFPWVW